MKRSPMPPRRKPLQRVSQKRQRLMRLVGPSRRAFLKEFPICWGCGKEPSKHVHEMASGSGREKSLEERCAWWAAGVACHRIIHRTNVWPLARQLAVKKRHDPEYYDRRRVNQLRGKDSEAVTAADVRKAGKSL